MGSSLNLLRKARSLIIEELDDKIIEEELNESLYQLKITLSSYNLIYIKYNDFGEYGYQIFHSIDKNVYSRFDNFDDCWDVDTNPHHFHQANNAGVISSPMVGDPEKDIPILAEYINKLGSI